MNTFRAGARLAKEGRNHLAYVNAMQDKEYEIADGTPEREIDARLFEVMLADLTEHKATCAGCTVAITEEIKAKLEEKGAATSRQARRRMQRLKEKFGI